MEVFIPFEELVDIEEEKERLEKEKERLEKEVERAKKMLSNPGFVAKAPEANKLIVLFLNGFILENRINMHKAKI